MRKAQAIAGLILANTVAAAAPARAAVFNIDLNVAQGVLEMVPLSDGAASFSAHFVYAPVTVEAGDTLIFHVSYPGYRFVLTDAAPLGTVEGIGFYPIPNTSQTTPDPSDLYTFARVTMSLLEPKGLLLNDPIFSQQMGFGGYVTSSVVQNLTDSSLSFTGAVIQVEVLKVSEPYTISRALFGGSGGSVQIVSVPEPASLSLLGVGLAAFAPLRGRRTRISEVCYRRTAQTG